MKKISILIVAFICLTLGANAQKKTLDKITAVVGSSIILKSDIEQQYAQYLAQGNPANPDIKCYILQQILTQKLLKQQADIDSVTVTEAQVDDEVDRRMRSSIQRAGGQDRLEQFLGRSVLQYKDELRPDVREQLIANKMQGKITEKVSITPMEVKNYFNTQVKDSLPTFPTEVEIGEVFMQPSLTKDEKQKYHDKIEEMRLRIKNGQDFATLASLYSQDPGSAKDGGDIGFMDRTGLVKEYAAWAFKLKPGEMSPVFETDFGFHILQVIERRGEQVHTRHILVIPQPTDASLSRVKLKADSIYNLINNKKMSFATAASEYSDSKDTKYNGGMMMNSEGVSSRTTFFPVDKLDPQIFLVIDTMKVGSVSKPFLFKGADGKEGYKIVTLKSKIPPHKANLDQDFPKIKDAANTDKLNRVVSEWFEKRRESTYIKIDDEFATCSQLKIWTKHKNDKK